MTIKQFFEILRDMGCEYKIQKYVYVRPPEAQRFISWKETSERNIHLIISKGAYWSMRE